MKPILLILTLILPLVSCHGQENYSADSVRFADAPWQVDSLDGFCLKRYQFADGDLFQSAQHLCLIEIPANSPRRIAFIHDTLLTEVSAFAQRNNAYAAINGSFFDMEHGNPICYLRIDGQHCGENTPAVTDSINRKYYQHATLALHKGRPHLLTPDSNRLWEESLPDSNLMTAGPMLIENGRQVPQRNDRTFVTRRHNRTALGIKADGTTLLLVADGRSRRLAEGLTLPELELLLQWLGCTQALNLDGGGSSTMYIQGMPYEGVVNYPSDNNRFDHDGQRPVSNAILLL